jgi:hypoxanthine phosphoribosyltransferase
MSVLNRVVIYMASNNSAVPSYVYNAVRAHINPVHYVSMEKIVKDTARWCESLGSDFDTVVALPRSGLMVGSTIACILGKPLSTPEEYIKGTQWVSSSFARYQHRIDFYNRVLLVDDSIVTGKQMEQAVLALKAVYPDKEVIKAALYVAEGVNVDRYYKHINKNHCWLCEYNLMHGKFSTVGFDIDGVLSEDWDGRSDYTRFLYTAKPYKIPVYDIDFVITARKEKYREITEHWLVTHNVKYKKLFMAPNDCKDGIKFKAKILLETKPQLYVESSQHIASRLHMLSGCPVVCIENNAIYK